MPGPNVRPQAKSDQSNAATCGPSAATPVEPSQPGGQMNAAPQGGNQSEQNEINQEEGK